MEALSSMILTQFLYDLVNEYYAYHCEVATAHKQYQEQNRRSKELAQEFLNPY